LLWIRPGSLTFLLSVAVVAVVTTVVAVAVLVAWRS
jgi:hypothetical protein